MELWKSTFFAFLAFQVCISALPRYEDEAFQDETNPEVESPNKLKDTPGYDVVTNAKDTPGYDVMTNAKDTPGYDVMANAKEGQYSKETSDVFERKETDSQIVDSLLRPEMTSEESLDIYVRDSFFPESLLSTSIPRTDAKKIYKGINKKHPCVNLTEWTKKGQKEFKLLCRRSVIAGCPISTSDGEAECATIKKQLNGKKNILSGCKCKCTKLNTCN